MVNLINLGFYDKLKILGLVLNLIWGFFVQIGSIDEIGLL